MCYEELSDSTVYNPFTNMYKIKPNPIHYIKIWKKWVHILIEYWGVPYENIPIPPDTILLSVIQMLKYKNSRLQSDDQINASEMNELMSIENAHTLFNLKTRDQVVDTLPL
jgi:hypothetical protein